MLALFSSTRGHQVRFLERTVSKQMLWNIAFNSTNFNAMLLKNETTFRCLWGTSPPVTELYLTAAPRRNMFLEWVNSPIVDLEELQPLNITWWENQF